LMPGKLVFADIHASEIDHFKIASSRVMWILESEVSPQSSLSLLMLQCT